MNTNPEQMFSPVFSADDLLRAWGAHKRKQKRKA